MHSFHWSGIDAEHIDLVVHVDVPRDAATYLHRVGRAGRFGAIGIAVSITSEGNDLTDLRSIVTKTKALIRILDTRQLNRPTGNEDTEQPNETKSAGHSSVSIQFLDSLWLELQELDGTGLDGEGVADSLLADIENSTGPKDIVRSLLPQGKTKTKKKDVKGKFRSVAAASDSNSVPDEPIEETLAHLNVNDQSSKDLELKASSSSPQDWWHWYHSWRKFVCLNKFHVEQYEYLKAMNEHRDG